MKVSYEIKTLGSSNLELINSLLDCFGEVFEEQETYCENRADADYIKNLLGSDTFIALVALLEGKVIGGLAAYELKKFEQKRSEIYIYDLAVYENHRRKGLATSLIKELKKIAHQRGAWVVFVQADYADKPAVNLYSKLGVREDVLHFDISIEG